MRIQVLDVETSNRIAAGEVVERPASVVKELCENALDAGATAITIEIEGGGLGYIRVVDNGGGMAEEDLPQAFLRHATSKIQSGDSLMGIESLGFRGEALSSVAAVSKVLAVSRQREAQMGSRIEIHGGQVISHIPYGSPEGTAITVRELFYNTPARLKFAKGAQTEAAQIGDILLRLMLANPQVAFRFLNANKVITQTPGSGLFDALTAVYGTAVANDCIEVTGNDEIRLFGYIGLPSLSRQTRAAQTLVVNGRYIRNTALSNAVAQGYGARLMTGRFPLFVLHLDMPYAAVDVNVHPQKIQVRFTDEAELSEKIKNCVAKAWRLYREGNADEARQAEPQKQDEAKTDPERTQTNFFFELPEKTADGNGEGGSLSLFDIGGGLSGGPLPVLREPNGIGFPFPVNDRNEPETKTIRLRPEYASMGISARPIGQLFDTYLLVQSRNSLLVIDQHAAHERLLYDELCAGFDRGETQSQALLHPVIVDLTYREVEAYARMSAAFTALGFEIEPFGETGLIVRAVPVAMTQTSVRAMLTEVLDLGQTGAQTSTLALLRERVIRSACRHSIKAGDALSPEELEALAKRLGDDIDLTCPHGRPIAVRITQRDLEKGFKRIV
jgi:DNA mismatch repair protein MutL